MQKSLFKKYLSVTMAVVLISYVVLGSIMMIFFTKYWEGEKKDLLTTNAGSIASFAAQYTSYDDSTDEYIINAPVMSVFIEVLSKNIDADIYLTDVEGNRLLGVYSCSGIDSNTVTAVNPEYVAQAMTGFCEFRSNFGKTYDKAYYTIGLPFSVADSSGNTTIAGAVFASTSSGSFAAYQSATIQMFLLAAIVTLILTFFLVWAFTYKMVKPLRQMSTAVKTFGNGDFSVRVPIEREDEIGELGLAFNNMANSLSNSEGMRRSFIANVSHELKTPMTTIGGFIDGILDGTIPQEKQHYYMKIVSDEIKRLSRLVKSMLDLSRIDSGEMKINPVKFDLTDTVCSTLLTFEKSITDKHIEIRGLDNAAPVNILGDQDLLHQVVYNLIENAVKFTNDGGYISFILTDSIDRACVAIENSGMGIPADDVSMVFDRFYKTDKSRSRDKNGMGLGLYLVRTIIKLHGGDISVQSVENSYCRFEFYIPKPADTQKPADTVIQLTENADDENDIQDVE
jgi:signal transduction histidine kinase